MFADQELSDYYNSLPESARDMSHAEFMAEVKRLLDPKRNAAILEDMVDMRHRDSIARQNKAAIDKARRNSAIGLR